MDLSSESKVVNFSLLKITKTIDEAVAFYTESSKDTKSRKAEEGVENLSYIPRLNNQWKKQSTVAVPERFITYVNKYSKKLKLSIFFPYFNKLYFMTSQSNISDTGTKFI